MDTCNMHHWTTGNMTINIPWVTENTYSMMYATIHSIMTPPWHEGSEIAVAIAHYHCDRPIQNLQMVSHDADAQHEVRCHGVFT